MKRLLSLQRVLVIRWLAAAVLCWVAAWLSIETFRAAHAQPIPGAREVLSRPRNFVTDFGAKGDGVADDTAKLNAAIAANWNKKVILPPGNYRITSPLLLEAPDGKQGNCTLEAQGAGWDVGSTVYPGTHVPKGSVKITADFKNGPAIAISGNLNVKIVGIEIEGLNHAPPGDDPNGGAYGSTITDKESDWVTGVTVSAAVDEGSTWLITTSAAHGYSSGDDIDLLDMKGLSPTKYTADEITVVSATTFRINADPFTGTYSASSGKATDIGCGRYNPYAGIAIDPAVGTKPTGGYDSLTYGKPISRWVWIENCVIRQFAVGIAVSPANTTLNADGVTIKDSLLTRNMYNVSVGHSNVKGLKIDNCDLNTALTAVECLTHGNRTGYPPQIVGGSIYLCYNQFHLSTQYGHFSCHGLYSEHCQMIGYLGHAAAALSKTAAFSGCVFDLADYGDTKLAANDSPLHLVTFVPTSFDGCTFYLPTGIFAVGGYYDNHTSFTNCSFRSGLEAIDWTQGPFIACNWSNLKPRVRLQGCSYTDDSWDPVTNPFVGMNWETELGGGAIPARIDLTHWSRQINAPDGTHAIHRSPEASDTSANVFELTASSPVWNAGVLTFTAASPERFLVGDVLAWETIAMPLASGFTFRPACLKVTNINGSTITATPQCDPNKLNQSFDAGSVAIFYRPYVHGAPVTGDTHTTTTVDNITSATSKFKVGDVVSGAGIPIKTRITAVGSTSITLSNAATTTATGVYLYNERLATVDGAVLDQNAPARGRWNVGDVVRNLTQAQGGVGDWVCTVAGAPGTWKERKPDHTILINEELDFTGASGADNDVRLTYDGTYLMTRKGTNHHYRMATNFTSHHSGATILAPVDKANLATTCSLAAADWARFSDGSATSVTDFACYAGQFFYVHFTNNNTTLVHNASKIVLPGATNWAGQTGDVLAFFVPTDGVAVCVGKSR